MKLNRLLTTVLLLVILLQIPCGAQADDLTVRYMGSVFPGDYTLTVPYDDGLFLEDARIYQHPLAQLSMGMALSAFRWSFEDEPDTNTYIQKFFEEAGFSDILMSDYEKSPSAYTISSCIARREIETGEEPFTLIAVAVCGGNYSGEWASNVTVGESDRHQGFSTAAELVENRILGYIARQKLSDRKIKIWISGYSRAAAVANITAADLTDLGIVPASDLFAYTFATPRAAKNITGTYPNIFNIIGKMDLVPKVTPAEWGYGRYGTDFYTPSRETDSDYARRALLAEAEFQELTGASFWNNVGNNLLLRLMYEYYLACVPDSGIYVNYMQENMTELFEHRTVQNALVQFIRMFTNPDLLDGENGENVEGFLNYLVQIVFETALQSGASSVDWVEDATLIGNLMLQHCPEIYMAWVLSSDDPEEIYSDSSSYVRISVLGDGNFAVLDHDSGKLVSSWAREGRPEDELHPWLSELETVKDYDSYDFYNIWDNETREQVLILPCDRNYDVWFLSEADQTLEEYDVYFESFLLTGGSAAERTLEANKGDGVFLLNTGELSAAQNPSPAQGDIETERQVLEYSPALLADLLEVGQVRWVWQDTLAAGIFLPVLVLCLAVLLLSFLIRLIQKRRHPEQPDSPHLWRARRFNLLLLAVVSAALLHFLLMGRNRWLDAAFWLLLGLSFAVGLFYAVRHCTLWRADTAALLGAAFMIALSALLFPLYDFRLLLAAIAQALLIGVFVLQRRPKRYQVLLSLLLSVGYILIVLRLRDFIGNALVSRLIPLGVLSFTSLIVSLDRRLSLRLAAICLFLIAVTAFVSAFYGETVSLPYVDSFFLHGFALALLSSLFVQASAGSTQPGS